MIIRSSTVLHKQQPQTHFFNCPKQLTKLPANSRRRFSRACVDSPSEAETFRVKLRDGDLVIAPRQMVSRIMCFLRKWSLFVPWLLATEVLKISRFRRLRIVWWIIHDSAWQAKPDSVLLKKKQPGRACSSGEGNLTMLQSSSRLLAKHHDIDIDSFEYIGINLYIYTLHVSFIVHTLTSRLQ